MPSDDPTEAALLRAVLEDPADDTVRLVYADYLEERGSTPECRYCDGVGERSGNTYARDGWCPTCAGFGRIGADAALARFIRAQIELRTFDTSYYLGFDNLGVCEKSAVPLVAETAALFRHAWVDRLLTLDTGVSLGNTHWEFRRGFAYRLDLPTVYFLDETVAAAVFGAQPIEQIRLTGFDPLGDGGAGTYLNVPPRPTPEQYHWFAGPQGSSLPWELPPQLYSAAMPAFYSEEAAHAWLSDRAVAWGRGRAGLPPLPPRKE